MGGGLGPHDLVLCAGTLPRASFGERVRAAVAGGFRGISLWTRHYERERATGATDADMRAMLADHGLVVSEIEALSDVLGTPGTSSGPGDREVTCYRIADGLGARSLSIAEGPGAPGATAPLADDFAAICDRAAAHGLLVHVEFWPGSRVDLATAIAVVREAARPNGGVLADSWHMARGPGSADVLRRATDVPILAVQMSDGTLAPSGGDYVQETMRRRRLPGEGEFDLRSFVRLVDERGSRAPIGVEVLSDALATLAPEEVGRRAGAAARAVIGRAREER